MLGRIHTQTHTDTQFQSQKITKINVTRVTQELPICEHMSTRIHDDSTLGKGSVLCSPNLFALVSMFPGTDVPSIYVPWYLCSLVLMFPVSMFPGTYVPSIYVPWYLCSQYLCSLVPMFPVSMFPGTYVPQQCRHRCSPLPMFPVLVFLFLWSLA